MQDRYAGDIGDFVKYALLRALSSGARLGVAWYLHPKEGGSGDGRHTAYLERPEEWRGFDEELFDSLRRIVAMGTRSVAAVQSASVLGNAVFADESLDLADVPVNRRTAWRRDWFERVRERLDDCDLVFADPDNGLVRDSGFRPMAKTSAKSIPEREARVLSSGRPALVYHHNTRRKGGHRAEIAEWQRLLPGGVYAYYWRRWSNRTFFLLNGDARTVSRLEAFAARWSPNGELIHPLGEGP